MCALHPSTLYWSIRNFPDLSPMTQELLMTPNQLQSSSCISNSLFIAAITLQVQAWTTQPAMLIQALFGTHERGELVNCQLNMLADWKPSNENLKGRGKFAIACYQTFPRAPQVNEYDSSLGESLPQRRLTPVMIPVPNPHKQQCQWGFGVVDIDGYHYCSV